MIGAPSLSEEARKLEMAAKAKDEAYLVEHHLSVVSEYDHLKRELFLALEAGDDAFVREDVLEFEPDESDDVMDFEPAE